MDAQANAGKSKGLLSSRFANAEGDSDATAANDDAAEGEDESNDDVDDEDHSSAALALVREPLC
jgi:hypothetical protein